MQLEQLINDYNGLMTKKNLNGRLFHRNGELFLGSVAQLNYGTYQCRLMKGTQAEMVNTVKCMMKAMIFEVGE